MLAGTADLVPKPLGRLPILVTGTSRQTCEWIAANADGWITYPRPLDEQLQIAASWHAIVDAAAPGVFKPIVQSLYIDLTNDPDHPLQPIHLGSRGGRHAVFALLDALRRGGMNHVILNFKYGSRHAGDVLEEIGREVLPRLGGG